MTKNSMQELEILLEKKVQEELLSVQEVAVNELKSLENSLREQLKSVESTIFNDTKKVEHSIKSRLNELTLQSHELKKLTIRPMFVLLILLVTLGVVLVLGLELWVSHQIKTVTSLETKIKNQTDIYFNSEQNILRKKKELSQLTTEGLEVMRADGYVYLVFADKKKKKPTLYQSTEGTWVVKQKLR